MPMKTVSGDAAELLCTPSIRTEYWDEMLAHEEATGDADRLRQAVTTLDRAMQIHSVSFGETLIQSAREALAIAKGLIPPAN